MRRSRWPGSGGTATSAAALPASGSAATDTPHGCIRGPDDDVYVCGSQGEPNAADIWIAEHTPAGVEEWMRVSSGPPTALTTTPATSPPTATGERTRSGGKQKTSALLSGKM